MDTAIDQGGPLRQFKSDVWKQLCTLSIPVWAGTERYDERKRDTLKKRSDDPYSKKYDDANTRRRTPKRAVVRIFEEVVNGVGSFVIPITDEVLISRVKEVALEDAEIQDAIQRAKDYARGIGRIMLHSFAHGHAVSSRVMAPIFMNGEPVNISCGMSARLIFG